MTYITSTDESEAKPEIIDALLESTPKTFSMANDEKSKFYEDALANYANFFLYIDGKDGNDAYKMNVLRHITSAGKQYGVDVSNVLPHMLIRDPKNR